MMIHRGRVLRIGLLAVFVGLLLSFVAVRDGEAKRRKRKPAATKKAPPRKEEPKKNVPSREPESPRDPVDADYESPSPTRHDSAVPSIDNRIEFDERLVAGQTAKPGTVRLFERRDSDLQTMIRTRRDLRPVIVRSILGNEPETKETKK